MNASIRFKLRFLITLFTILPLGAKAQDGAQKLGLLPHSIMSLQILGRQKPHFSTGLKAS